MAWPTSQDYNEAIQNAATSFADPELKKGEVALNSLGLPVPRSGNFADVYEFKTPDGKKWALKLFTRKVAGLQERYAKIDEHLSKAMFPFTVGFKYLAQGIRIRNEWYPLLKMEWVDGFTLNEFIRENADKPQYLHALMQMWGKLAALLRDANFAHADLQHGNVLLVPATKGGKLGLRLIDYDGMWVPALAETHSGEVGHPNFQHPLRLKDRLYSADVDRFPHLVITAALRATMIGGKTLWEKYDNGDNLLFKEADLRDPANATIFKALWNMHDDTLCTLVGKLALGARDPLRKTPWLDDVLFEEGGPKLAEEEEMKVLQYLGVSPHFTATKQATAPPTPVRQKYSDFETADGEHDDPRAPERTEKQKKAAKEEKVKSKLPLYIGGGVAAALLLIVGVVIGTSGTKKETGQQEVVKNDDKGREPVIRQGDLPKIDKLNIDPPAKKAETTKVDPPEKKVPPKLSPPIDPNSLVSTRWTVTAAGVTLSFTADSSRIAMTNGSSYRTYSLQDGSAGESLSYNHNPLRMGCLTDGSIIGTFTNSGLTRLFGWEPATRKERYDLRSEPLNNHNFALAVNAGIIYAPLRTSGVLMVSAADGRKMATLQLPGADAAVTSVSCTSDGEVVLANIGDVVYVRPAKAQAFRRIGTINVLNNTPPVSHLSPDGKHFMHYNGGKSIYVFECQTCRPIATLDGHTSPVDVAAFTPDGRHIISAGDATMRVWDVAAGREIGQVPTMEVVVPRKMAISGDGRHVVMTIHSRSGTRMSLFGLNLPGAAAAKVDNPPAKVEPKNNPNVGEVTELKQLWKVTARTVTGKPAAVSHDGGTAMFVSDGALSLHNIKNGEKLDSVVVSEKGQSHLFACPDGSVLVRKIGVPPDTFCWDVKENKRRYTLDEVVSTMAVSPAGNKIFAKHAKSGVSVYSLKDGSKLEHIESPMPNQHLANLACTSDGEALLIITNGNQVHLRTSKSQPFKSHADLIDFKSGMIPSIQFSPDAKYYMQYRGVSPKIIIYDSSTGKQTVSFEGHPTQVRDAAFTPDGRFVVSIGNEAIRLWNAGTGKEIKRAMSNALLSIAISPDGRTAVTGMVNDFAAWSIDTEGIPTSAKE